MTSSRRTPEPVRVGRLEHFRAVRRAPEAAVLPLATSIDGRRFSFTRPSTKHPGQILLELDQREGTESDRDSTRRTTNVIPQETTWS
jgi:hypothetical protein